MSKGIKIVLFISFIGFLFGIFFVIDVDKNNINLLLDDSNDKVKVFFNTFTINYWYIFLFWAFSLNSYCMFISYGILFLKCSMLGIVFCLLIKTNALFGVGMFIGRMFGQILFIIPIMYFILLSSSNEKNKILISTIFVMFYSILNSLI